MRQFLVSFAIALSAFGALSAAAPKAGSCPAIPPLSKQPGLKQYNSGNSKNSNQKSSRDLEERGPPTDFPKEGLYVTQIVNGNSVWEIPKNAAWYFKPDEKFNMNLNGDIGLVFIDKCATYGINIPGDTDPKTNQDWRKAVDSFRYEKGLTPEAKVFFVSPNTLQPQKGGQYQDRVNLRDHVADQLDMRGFKFMQTEYCKVPNGSGSAKVSVDGKGNAMCQQRA